MKSILLSIKPKYVADILNGKKTIEVRKSYPKCNLPIDVYIYCTKQKILGNLIKVGSKEISDLVGKNTITGINKGFMKEGDIDLQGKVVAKFTLRKVEEIFTPSYITEDDNYYSCDIDELLKQSCLTEDELTNYIGEDNYHFFAYHIEDLVIFDKPRELSSFCKVGCIEKLENYIMTCPIQKLFQREMPEEVKQWVITKAPQSYCFVESEE